MSIREQVAKRRANWDGIRGITTPFRAATIVASAEDNIEQLLELVDRTAKLIGRACDDTPPVHSITRDFLALKERIERIVGTPQGEDRLKTFGAMLDGDDPELS